MRKKKHSYFSKIFLSEVFLTILPLRKLAFQKRLWSGTKKKKRKNNKKKQRPDLMFECVFHMFDVGCDWLEFIHKFTFLFFPSPASSKLQSLRWVSNGPKNCGTNCLNMGKFLSRAFWLIAVMCYVSFSHRGERIAIILTETTQQKHGPLLSVYCIMGVTGYLSPILRSLLVFPTRYDSFTTARLRPGLLLTSWTAAVLRLSHNLSLSLSLSCSSHFLLRGHIYCLCKTLSLFHFLSL